MNGRKLGLACAATGWLLATPAGAYPEFQKWVQASSGRGVSCSLCHAHPDGPEGVKAGQLGSLDAEGRAALDQARTAFEPGVAVRSPILNEFGNSVIKAVGKTRFVALREHPEQLPALLDGSDLDGDGISDGQELRDGTHPLDPGHGAPAKLLRINLGRYRFHLGMLAAATALGLYGLRHLLQWFGANARKALAEGAQEEETP